MWISWRWCWKASDTYSFKLSTYQKRYDLQPWVVFLCLPIATSLLSETMKRLVSSRFVSSFWGSQTWIQLISLWNCLSNISHNSIIFMYSIALHCLILAYCCDIPAFSCFQQAINIHCNVVLSWPWLWAWQGHLSWVSSPQNRGDEWRKHPNTGVKLFKEIPRNSPIDFCINFDFPLSKWVSCNDPWQTPAISPFKLLPSPSWASPTSLQAG